jgi:mono/diheme cytochrome c family protein
MRRPGPWIAIAIVATALVACAQETRPGTASITPRDAGTDAKSLPSSDASISDATGTSGATLCLPVHSSEAIPARTAVTSATVAPAETAVFVEALYNAFDSSCGGCHVDTNLGGFQVSKATFPTKIDQTVLARITSTDPTQSMPPIENGSSAVLFAKRGPNDPIVALVAQLKQWIAAGSPPDVFYVRSAEADAGSVSPYVLSKTVGANLTNIGDCLPDKRIVGTDAAKAASLDAFFEKLQKSPAGQGSLVDQLGLPEHLEQTDLFTLDTETLARYGVIAYAPGYPLWSDNARKLRHIRVPVGQSVHFDKATQAFSIPANTRFYKTFLKPVIEASGQVRYRKMETRLIVSRPNQHNADGTFTPTALFGTYAWNDAETEATLVTDTLRNSEPFTDRLFPYVTDEGAADKIQSQHPANLTYQLEQAHAIRRYAIPGRDRCIECHMGSATESFSLGFLPLQIARRSAGVGGVIEPSGPDELTQLARLVDYGVITGIQSPSDVLPLEKSEGTRPPRNDFELAAQGYMLGNCSHCHNPNGFPSVTNPVLAPVLNFLPTKTSGVFQFPLETTSPRIFRGVNGSTPIPYITPSLMDLPVTSSDEIAAQFYQPKSQDESAPNQPDWIVAAPWRSLIYRNVDTPFTYSDDLALFPHMPMNTPGYDCRVPRILGDWMVSIPAKRKSPDSTEYAVWVDGEDSNGGNNILDTNVQPYTEVKPTDPDYATAVAGAQTRLRIYHEGLDFGNGTYPRYPFCPDTSDIVDPAVIADPVNHPVPTDALSGISSGNPPKVVMPQDGVPDHAHWVVTDLTEITGPWTPRRPDWETVLVGQNFPNISQSDSNYTVEIAKQQALKKVVQTLQNVTLTDDFKSYALAEAPFGLWQSKSGCDFSSVPKLSAIQPAPAWLEPLTLAKGTPAPTSPVYMQAPGASVFNMICINCHGPRADGQGRQADILLQLTGGNTRVANLRDGLFGPEGDVGANRQRVFGTVAEGGVTADTWGARYLAFMGLGGTQRVIPSSILAIVANTQVLGQARMHSTPPVDANMLASAHDLCQASSFVGRSGNFILHTHQLDVSNVLIQTNGDADLWLRLCRKDNPHPVVALSNLSGWGGEAPKGLIQVTSSFDLFSGANYPKDAPVGDQDGNIVTGITPDNLIPWCWRKPITPALLANATAFLNDPANLIDGKPMPFCPTEVVPLGDQGSSSGPQLKADDLEAWATRGAINAGLSVFTYLDAVARGLVPKPTYDHCEQLNAH